MEQVTEEINQAGNDTICILCGAFWKRGGSETWKEGRVLICPQCKRVSVLPLPISPLFLSFPPRYSACRSKCMNAWRTWQNTLQDLFLLDNLEVFFPLLTTLSTVASSASLWIWRWHICWRYCCLKTWHQGDQQPNLVPYLGVSDILELGEKTIWDAGQGGSLCLWSVEGKDVLPGSGANSSKTGSIWMRSNSGLELVWHLSVDKPLGSTVLGNECEKCFVKCEFLYQYKEL